MLFYMSKYCQAIDRLDALTIQTLRQIYAFKYISQHTSICSDPIQKSSKDDQHQKML